MPVLLPVSQEFFDLNTPGLIVGVTTIKLVSTSDTVTLPTLADTTSGVSVKQLERSGDATNTVTSSGNTVTVTGTVGDVVILASLHTNVNSNPEV